MKNKNTLLAALLLFFSSLTLGATAESHGSASPKTEAAAKPEARETSAKDGGATADARATPVWQPIYAEAGRRVEMDKANVKKLSDGKIQAYGRILFDRPIPDAVSGDTYQILEALNNYDCDKRTLANLRRIFRKDEKSVLREENSPGKAELPVRSGSLDERILRAACRPSGADSKSSFSTTVSKAKAAAEEHALDNRKELLRTSLGNTEKHPTPHAKVQPSAPTKSHSAPPPAKKSEPASHQAEPVQHLEHVHWAYEGLGGPENWGKLSPDNKLCDSGQRQSPIDIRDGIGVDLAPISFSYRPSIFRIINNGHTVQAGISDNRISLLGKEYELIQFHFHRPSEERVNGRGFDMVAHLVHKSYDGQLAVVAVLMERGSENPFIQTLWNYLPLETNQPVMPPGVLIDLNNLLPEKRGYFTYMGSLTTPPCTEGVLWLVMQAPVQVSPAQINIFSRLFPNNARPIQPQRGRLIKESR